MGPEQLNQLLKVGVEHGASDIHFKVGSPPSYRVHGQLRNLKSEKLMPAETLALAEALIRSGEERRSLTELHEYDTSYSVPGVARFRVNIFRQRGTLSCILHVIPREVPTAEALGLPDPVIQIAQEERGLVLVTGAAGAGKSSTLSAMIDHINRHRNVHVLTIEDPIEFLHRNEVASISQRELGIDTANYKTAMRAALRQDPDVIMLSDLNERETLDIAMKSAEMGRLVLSSTHTTDALKTVNALLAMYSSEEQPTVRQRLADNLRGVVCQQLAPRRDGQGRALIAEVMTATPTIRDYIRDPERTQGIRTAIEDASETEGMQTFDQHLVQLVREKVISLETARGFASSEADLRRAIQFERYSKA